MMTRANHFRMLAIVVAVAVALTLALALQDPAYSDITLTVNMTSDAVDINPGDGRCDVDLHDQELVLLGEGDLGGRGLLSTAAPALPLLAVIHPSAWKVNSAKFARKIVTHS